MAQQASEWFNTATQIFTGAKFKTFGSTNDLLHHFAWGARSWLMGEEQLAEGIQAILTQLQKIEQRLDRLERVRRV